MLQDALRVQVGDRGVDHQPRHGRGGLGNLPSVGSADSAAAVAMVSASCAAWRLPGPLQVGVKLLRADYDVRGE